MVYIDAEGNFAFLAAVGIGAGIGGLISGVAKVIDNVCHDKDWHDGLGKAVLSGAVSGAVTAIPIPGVGPLASATITGAASNLAVDAINGDINSFKDAALSLTEGAVTGAVSHGVNKCVSKLKSNSKVLTQGKNVFPENPDDLLPEIPRSKVSATGQTINTSDRLRIRAEKHPIKPGETYNPRHHGTHYHVEYRIDTSKGWNNKRNVSKIHPNGYTPGGGTGFLPGETFPGSWLRR